MFGYYIHVFLMIINNLLCDLCVMLNCGFFFFFVYRKFVFVEGLSSTLHIKALVEGKTINRVLIDEEVAISLLPKCMLKKFGKDLVRTNVAIKNYYGKPTATKGVMMLNVRANFVD